MEKSEKRQKPRRKNRTICLPFTKAIYLKNIKKASDFRKLLDERIESFPELFPSEISKGYKMKDKYFSEKQQIHTRRITIQKVAYTVRPSFVMPYMSGVTDEVANPLLMRKFNTPVWGLSEVFGKYSMYWYRLEQSLGRNSIVGTTIRNPDDIPEDLGADEKHSWVLGEKVFIATSVGNECILGASIAQNAGEKALTKAYGVFKAEAQCLKPTYSANTVNNDGWKATLKAWANLFPSVIIIHCFLHVFIKIRDRAKKKYEAVFCQAASKLWECHHAKNKRAFSQRIRRLIEWCEINNVPDVISKPIKKLRNNIKGYSNAYDHPNAHRTSNMIDRLMQRMDRHLFSTQYFHGSLTAAELSIRGWVLIHNFAPSNPRTVKKYGGYRSPAERLNRFRYSDNWLENLLISASLGGYRSPPLNPL